MRLTIVIAASAAIAHMIPIVCNVALVVILYDLFKVVDRRIALMMVFYSLVGTAVESANLLAERLLRTRGGGQRAFEGGPVGRPAVRREHVFDR